MSESVVDSSQNIAAEILAAINTDSSNNGNQPLVSPAGPAPRMEPGRTAQPLAAAPARVEQSKPAKTYYTFKQVAKQHESLIVGQGDARKFADGVDPSKIEHLPIYRAMQKGCQCPQCKKGRSEVFVVEDEPSSNSPLDPILGDLLSEEFIALLMDQPNEAMRFLAEAKDWPEKVKKMWTTDDKKMALYGKYGKILADHYLRLPDFKHKHLILIATWYSMDFGMKLSGSLMLLKAMKKVQTVKT